VARKHIAQGAVLDRYERVNTPGVSASSILFG
jgi:hypothetical protein